MPANDEDGLHDEAHHYYQRANEGNRLATGHGRLELARVREILVRFLPPAPARILDVGGAEGIHALWLAGQGYEVHLIDAHPPHVEAAREASARQPDAPLASASVGNATGLEQADSSMDAVLLFGPLYHLTERSDRLEALGEARRVLLNTGQVFALAVSRYASTFQGLFRGFFDDPQFVDIAARDRRDGQHRNPTGDPRYFTTTYFHRPSDLADELAEAGFRQSAMLAIQGIGALIVPPERFDEYWLDDDLQERLLATVRALESEDSLLGATNHFLAVGVKDPPPPDG